MVEGECISRGRWRAGAPDWRPARAQVISAAREPRPALDLRPRWALLLPLLAAGVACSGSGHQPAKLVSGSAWRRSIDEAPSPQAQAQVNPGASGQNANVPYKTFYVTRACEWKSNLFVPKSNDIHFAQAASLFPGQPDAGDLPSAAPNGRQQVSSVLYDSQQQQQQQQQELLLARDPPRTIMSTPNKALVLALPISTGSTFAGYEPACSIRLIVPKNMRILAKLSSRRLSFAQEQHSASGSALWLAASSSAADLDKSLWLNVSQNQFVETEQRTIETEGNILAFRFLLERFANRQVPDTRFQVVLTAFQTLGENSDSAIRLPPLPNVDNQILCDQQRIISANLACDGFKNCQDGHDEEASTCSSLRNAGQPQTPSWSAGELPTNAGNFVPPNSISIGAGDLMKPSQPSLSSPQPATSEWFWSKIWSYLTRDTSSLVGFLLGFLLVLILLTCCSCCAYLMYLAWRRSGRLASGGGASVAARSAARRHEQVGGKSGPESEALAVSSPGFRPGPPPPRIQSILKRPPPLPSFERPVEPPPAVPSRSSRPADQTDQAQTTKRGALASSLGAAQRLDFRPTPARRLHKPTRPPPAPKPPGTQRITTYHYSSGSMRLSDSYIQRLAQQSRPTAPSAAAAAASPSPSSAARPNSSGPAQADRTSGQSSLI